MVFLIRPFSSIRTLCGVYDSWCIRALHGGQLRTQGIWENLGWGIEIHNFWTYVLYGWPRVSMTHLTLMIYRLCIWLWCRMVFYLNLLYFFTWCCFLIDFFSICTLWTPPFGVYDYSWCIHDVFTVWFWWSTIILWVSQAGDFEKKIGIHYQPWVCSLWTAPILCMTRDVFLVVIIICI